MGKNNFLLLSLLPIIFLQGCIALNMLPSSKRDAYYMDHGPTFHDHFYKVHVGMSSTEVLEILGSASDFKGDDIWVYIFPDDWVKVFYLEFENGKIIKQWN